MQLSYRWLDGRDGHSEGRALLAQMMGGTLPEIRTTPQGKPYFVADLTHFSISHTKSHVFCCISDKNIGIDAEPIGRQIDLRLAKRYLSDAELSRFQAAQDPSDALLRLWVLKESWAKLTGKGIGNYLKETDFDPFDPRITEIDGCYVAVLEE